MDGEPWDWLVTAGWSNEDIKVAHELRAELDVYRDLSRRYVGYFEIAQEQAQILFRYIKFLEDKISER